MVARKKVGKKSKASAGTVLKWDFPARELHILRIEMFALLAFAVFIFWFMYYQFEQHFFGGALSVILFVSLYFVISSIVKRIHYVEEKYHLTKTHLTIVRLKNGKKIKTEKVNLSEIILHKFDHFFLGAYLLTDTKKHCLFFNNSEESRKVHAHLEKQVKKK